MAIHVSPGVYSKIVDLSEYVRAIPSTIGFVPMICERGPDNVMVLTNGEDFYRDFGDPDIDYVGGVWGQGPYVASAYLSQSDALYVCRVLPDNATFSSLVIRVDASLGPGDTSADVAIDWTVGQIVKHSDWFDTKAEYNEGTYNYPIIFYAVGRGEWYNDFKVSMEKHTDEYRAEEEHLYVLKVWRKQDLDVDAGAGVQTYRYEVIETFEVSVDYTQLDSNGQSAWIKDVVNNNSRYIRCAASETLCATAITNEANFQDPFRVWSATAGDIDPDTGNPTGAYVITPQSMAGNNLSSPRGSSGSLLDANGVVVASEATKALMRCMKGIARKPTSEQSADPDFMSEILDKDILYFSLVFCPYDNLSVLTAADYLTKTREDCVAIVGNGNNYKTSTALTNRGSGITYGLNNKAVAIYDGYTKIFDVFCGKDIWLSPVYQLAQIIPYSDNISDIWYAPAGFNRATISGIKEMRYSPNLATRDLYYLAQINPIVRFYNEGDVVFGQLTSQRRPTALQDLNTVRTVLYIQRALEQFCKYYIFEMNDEDTWGAIKSKVSQFLSYIKQKRGLRNFTISVGATDYELKAKICHIDVILEPMKVIEQIHLTFFVK